MVASSSASLQAPRDSVCFWQNRTCKSSNYSAGTDGTFRPLEARGKRVARKKQIPRCARNDRFWVMRGLGITARFGGGPCGRWYWRWVSREGGVWRWRAMLPYGWVCLGGCRGGGRGG